MREILETLWKTLTFQPLYRTADTGDVVIGILMWILVIIFVGAIGYLVWMLLYTIYRVIAYDYEVVTLPATVADKSYKAARTTWVSTGKTSVPIHHSAEYNISIITDNNLDGVINDEDLYDWAQKGFRFWVTMKIGKNRKAEREIKYWRVINYTWDYTWY